ncbi:MAG TPA: ATP-binding protein [Thermoanaerobaculaceae bacterium]|nr:ATP-binding protein [Thermoanaerobaculaceae bacterium]
MRDRRGALRRQYLVAAGVFAALLVATFVLFVHLMGEQLSRSYLEDVLLSGKAEAEELARQMKGSGSVYNVVETRREALAQISAALARKQVIDKVQVFDNRGKLAWRAEFVTEGLTGGFPDGNADLVAPPAPEHVVESTRSYQIRAPLEDIGTVVISVSKSALAGRIAILRRDLLVNTALAAGGALSVLLGAVGFIWHLVQRNARLDEKRRLSEDLAALGSLAANLAHEIRNPLNALSINLELLEEDMARNAAPSDTVGLARREVGRLSRLVNDFLVYARPSPPAPESFPARELLRDVAALLDSTCIRYGVSLEVDADDASVWADRGQLSQVLVNLALNAVQALDGAERKEVVLRARDRGADVALEVADTGAGIPAAELARVREAFYTRRKGGTGLGLAIADRIVGAHGGKLELANREAGGLLARVVLPKPAAG